MAKADDGKEIGEEDFEGGELEAYEFRSNIGLEECLVNSSKSLLQQCKKWQAFLFWRADENQKIMYEGCPGYG